MLRTKNIIQSIYEVPDTWVYEYYAPIPAKLTGQRVSILSIFNATDTNPSLVFYTKGGTYMFKDFSEGIQGDKVDFYRYYAKYKLGKDISNSEAVVALIYTYSQWILNNNYRKVDIVDEAKFKVESFELRTWYDYDAKYYGQFCIPSKVLEYFIIKPLKSLIVSNGIQSYNIKKGMTYGYFKKDGTLYKTYAPLESKDKKFNNYVHYIQGWEQLRCHGGTLVICSSLKDGAAVFSMYPNVDVVAPTSENSYLSLADIEYLKKHYSKIYILFDYDEAGDKAALVYKDRFALDQKIIVPLSKDVSDSVRDHTQDKVKIYLNPYLL